MTTDQPRVNQSGFVAVHQHSILAIVPDGRLHETTGALAEVGVDLTRVDVLQGEIGADILDFDGTKHGLWARNQSDPRLTCGVSVLASAV
jgi:hypothetical protein